MWPVPSSMVTVIEGGVPVAVITRNELLEMVLMSHRFAVRDLVGLAVRDLVGLAELEARGVHRYVDRHVPEERHKKCGAVGCKLNHESHHCGVCGKDGVKHLDEDCDLYKRRDYSTFY